jgi:putative peptidoglycan lipid II flippase
MKITLRLIPAGSIVLGITTLASYGVGLLRDRIFAQTFGASRVLDAYNAAFLIPDLLFNILIASGIAAAFVPILTELLKSEKTSSEGIHLEYNKRAREYVNTIITGAMGTMTLIAGIIIIFAGKISILIAPGFQPQDQLLVAQILRYLALSPIIFGISNTLGAMLVVKRRFIYYGLSPVLYNLGIIGGTLLLTPYFGIIGVAIGTIIGASLHLLIRVFDVIRSGFKFKFTFNPTTPEFKKTISLMIPKMFGHPVELATFWSFTVFASMLKPGSVAIMSFARNFQSVPVSLIGITIATTTFPLLAQAVTDHSFEQFRKILKRSFWLIFSGSMLAAIVIFIIREPLIRIVFGGGAFNQESVARTALTLGIFTLAIPTESLVQLIARAFYATKNTTIPVVLSVIGFIISTLTAFYLISSLDIIALPLAFFIASATELILLLIFISKRLQKISKEVGKDSPLPHIERV